MSTTIPPLPGDADRQRGILDSMLEGCQFIDREWRYVYLNDSAIVHSGHSREELIGRTMMEAYPGIDATPMFASLRTCMDYRIPARMENRFEYPDGSAAWFDLSMQPMEEGVFVLSIDITDRKRAEEALREANEDLERRVAERTRELEASNRELLIAKHEAEAANIAKGTFLSRMSHELRTPLNAILGFAQLLELDDLTPPQRESVQHVVNGGRHLLGLINEILSIVEVETPKAHTDPQVPAADLPPARGSAGQHRISVLSIEDNPANVRLLEMIFARRPQIALRNAVRGDLGLDLARQHSPDLILLDLNLPDLPGAEVLARLRQSAATRDIPVIVLSADADAAQIDRLLAAGARAYLSKPLDVAELLRTVDSILAA